MSGKLWVMQLKLLVLGCGLKPKACAVNLDRVKLPGVDVVFNLDSIAAEPWRLWPSLSWNPTKPPDCHLLPFLSGEFDRAEAEDVLEHVADPIAVVQEIGRVLKVGGELWLRGPDCMYPETAWADLTHRRLFAPRSFDGFDPDTWDGRQYGYYHGPIKFHIKERATKRNMGLEWTLVRRV